MAPEAASKRVLIIDDEQDIVDLISEVLARDNYEPVVATVWTEAIDAIVKAGPDLMLLDLKMPTIDGSAILEFIRKEGIQLPVIVVSGFLTDDVMANLSELGVAAFIRKPFKVGHLKSEIERVLGSAAPRGPAPAAATEGRQAEQEVLNAFQKLGGSGSRAGGAAARADTGQKGPEAPSEEASILQAFQKLDAPQADSAAAPRTKQPRPRPSPEEVAETFRRQTAQAQRSAPSGAPPEPPPRPTAEPARAPEAPPDAEVPLESEERRHHRTRHHGRRRSRSATRRNLVYMGIITLVCIFVAAFLAVMQWYASEVDVAEIKKGATKSVQEQVKQELLKELKKNQK